MGVFLGEFKPTIGTHLIEMFVTLFHIGFLKNFPRKF
ncbi:hypothetical protein [Lactococcus phage PMBT68]|nr:hypothetical protein [Lactococcus phage P1411]